MHSPYAFKLIKDVVRPGIYGFYSYWKVEKYLDKKERSDYRFINSVRFTIRLVVFLQSKRIVSSETSRLGKIVALALELKWVVLPEKKDFLFEKTDLFLINGNDKAPDEFTINHIKQAINAGSSIFAINPSSEIQRVLEAPMKYGLFLYDKNCLILIPRKEMAYVSYPVSLRLFKKH